VRLRRIEFVDREAEPSEIERYAKFLRHYVWKTDKGRVVVMPIVSERGDDIFWQARVYKKGVAGYLAFNKDTAKMIGLSDEDFMIVQETIHLLESEFRALPTVEKAKIIELLRAELKPREVATP